MALQPLTKDLAVFEREMGAHEPNHGYLKNHGLIMSLVD
jgi:hypothetical protein